MKRYIRQRAGHGGGGLYGVLHSLIVLRASAPTVVTVNTVAWVCLGLFSYFVIARGG